jgi:outer membrane protein assembly factor BamB
MQSIEILIGSSWFDGRMGERIRHESGSGEGRIDFSAILDTIDILIDGANVSAAAGEDAVFLMFRDMLAGCDELASGRSHRVTLSFYESPWELVFKREGHIVLVSFFRGGIDPMIEVKDGPVPFADLIGALVEAGDTLVARLEALNPRILADPFVGEILGALERLRAVVPGEAGGSHDESQAIELSFEGAGGGDGRVAFHYGLVATSRDLLCPTTPNRADLYSLMASGQLSCLADGVEVFSVGGRVFFMIEILLLLARQLLTCMEEHRDLDLVLRADALCIEARYDAGSEALTVTLSMDVRRSGHRGKAEASAVLGGISIMTFAEAVLDVARDFRRQVLDVNPSQRSNLKFEMLASEVDDLTTWKRDLTDAAYVNTSRSQLRYEMPRPTLPRRSDEGPFLAARRLMYAKRWEVEAEGLRLDATFLCGDRLVLGTRSVIAALDREAGDPLWRRAGLPGRALALMTGKTGLLTMAPSGEVTQIDVESGQTRWSTRVPPPPGRPAGMTAGGGRHPRFAVLTTGESGIVAIDLFTGESRWRFRARRGRPTGLSHFGRLIALTCHSNSVYCLDADSGDLVWRFSERSRFDLPPVNLGDKLALWSTEGDGRCGKVFVLDGMSGELLWKASTDGKPLAPPVQAGDRVILALGVPGNVRLQAWKASDGLPDWERGFDGQEGPVALMSMDDWVFVNTAQGSVINLDGVTGRVRWMHGLTERPGVDLPLNLEPVLRDGGLFVPFDTTYVLSPMDGTLLHRLEGESPVPDLLRVDEHYSIYTAEISGHVGAYGVVGHLNVVKN